MWEFKECREAIKKTLWSYNRAQEGEKEFKQNTLRNPKRGGGDILADVDAAEEDKSPAAERDERRYVSFEEKEQEDGETSTQYFNESISKQRDQKSSPALPRPPEYEMKEFGFQDVPSDEADENDSLIRRSLRQKKQTKNGSSISASGRPLSYRE